MNNEIEAKRKELKDNSKNYHFTDADKHYYEVLLHGLNLGVEMARKEFLEFLQKITLSMLSDLEIVTHSKIENKIEELKQSLEEKS